MENGKLHPNGTIFLKYILKEDQKLTHNMDNDDIRSDRVLETIAKKGTEVQINLSATWSGNYAEIIYRTSGTFICQPNMTHIVTKPVTGTFTFKMTLDKQYADQLVTKYANKFNQIKYH